MLSTLFASGMFMLQVVTDLNAPYCVGDPLAVRCWFYSAQECAREAERVDGVCYPNPENPRTPTGRERLSRIPSGQGEARPVEFCLVTDDAEQCWFRTRQECREEAAKVRGGVCVYRPAN